MARNQQLSLFESAPEPPPLDLEQDERLMQRVPSCVRFGTSSWTFAGWGGIVYPGAPTERELIEDGLATYAKHPLFRTVGIDRSYYRPLTEETLTRYAAQLPDGFPCVSKVTREITSAETPGGDGKNRHFLDAERCVDVVLRPLDRAFSEHTGPLVFEFPPTTRSKLDPDAFAAELARFFEGLPSGFEYAVELRNPELLSPRYLDVLEQFGVAHVFNFWEKMPPIGVQLDLPGVLPAPFVVCRCLIPPGRRYAERREALAPFNRLVEVQEGMRRDVARLAAECLRSKKTLYVIVNNKAEGSSPLTVRALAARVARIEE